MYSKARIKLAAASLAAALVTAGGAQAQVPAAAVSSVTVKGVSQPVTRALPGGFNVAGSYAYPEGGQPLVQLNADGTGAWRGDTGEAARDITWWFLADAAGTAQTETHPRGQQHTLLVDFGGGRVSGFLFTVATEARMMVINGDRVRPF